MKHKSFIPLLGFFLLFGAASCTEPIEVNPNYNSETKEVTTQFVLNVNTRSPQTKMTADVVQLNENFRGIEKAKIYAFKSNISSPGTPYVNSTTATPEKYYDLDKLFSADALDNTDGNNQSGENATASKRVLQLSVPVGVDAILFYGKAMKANGAKDEQVGATNMDATTFGPTPGSTVIAAQKILAEGNVESYDATASLMIFLINDILSIGVPASGTTLPAVTWAQYGHRYEFDKMGSTSRYPESMCLNHPLNGLEELLGRCYYLFSYILPPVEDIRPNGEYRAGSSSAVKKMVTDFFKVLSAVTSASPTTDEEANAKRLASAIIDRANLYFNSNPGDATPDGNYEEIDDIHTRLVNYQILTETEWTEKKFDKAKDLNGYPFEDFGVPEGAAQLGFHYQGETVGSTTYTKDEFYYHHPNYPLVNPTMTEFEPRKYLYPAELWYYVNSPVRTTDNEVTVASYPDGVTPWNTGVPYGGTASDSKWTSWTFPGKVGSSTRGVAVYSSINYGVAMLKTNVVYKDGVTALEDNRSALTNGAEQNKSIDIVSGLLELRGVLVGGVNPRMDWQFTRKYTTGSGSDNLSLFDGVIYDHSLPSNAVPTSLPNYTLVYDNYNSSEGGQNDVYVALEFVNKGEDFYGRDNMIPSGGVFYLVAKLNKPTSNVTWPTDHQIPPVWGVDGETVTSPAVAGESKKIPRVFIQDFMTSATFRINETSLQKAYYSVPDLRASQMSLGLSVDLQWNPGFDYTLDL